MVLAAAGHHAVKVTPGTIGAIGGILLVVWLLLSFRRS
jgi:hypothetical protein